MDIPIIREKRPETGESGGYVPEEDLFPEAHRLRKDGLQAYVQRRMEELAIEGKLCLTDLFNQPPDVKIAAGRVIMGERVNRGGDNELVRDVTVPPAIASTLVRVRSLDTPSGRHTIAWKKGLEPSLAHRTRYFEERGLSVDGGKRVVKLEPVYYDTGLFECALPIQHAWNLLRQAGKYCRREPTVEGKARNWWFVECIVDDRERDQEKKREAELAEAARLADESRAEVASMVAAQQTAEPRARRRAASTEAAL